MKRSPAYRRLILGLVTLAVLLLGATPARAFEQGINFSVFPPAERLWGNTADLKAQWVRVFMNWAHFEPERKGSYAAMGEYDAAVARASASGLKVMMVITNAPSWASGAGNGKTPPRNPQDYADFAKFLATKYKGKVNAYEIWNEPDGDEFWENGPEPARYTQLLQAAYPAIKEADSQAKVYTGPTVGNNYEFIGAIYDNLSKSVGKPAGSGAPLSAAAFDGVSVHTDTACNLRAPDEVYRELDGRLGRFIFTGYREIRTTMVANGDASKPIAMSELGWSTSRGKCATGSEAGVKDGGVTEEQQATFLTQAYHCLSQDSYIGPALWFNLQDVSDQDVPNDHKFGLMRTNFSNKPAYDAYKSFFTVGNPLTGPCGGQLDSDKPKLTVRSPSEGRIFDKTLPISVEATDDQRVSKIRISANGQEVSAPTKEFNGGVKRTLSLNWQGARKLAIGPVKLVIQAFDDAQNVSVAEVMVEHINPATHVVRPTFSNFKVEKLQSTSRVRTVRGNVVSPQLAGLSMLGFGKVKIVFQNKRIRYRTKSGILTNRNLPGRRKVRVWVTVHKFSKSPHEPYKFGARMAGNGEWRARAEYPGVRPFGKSKSKWIPFRVRGAR